MRNLQFENWQRVSKAYFQKAYLNGEKVCVAPCNVNLDSFWYGGNGFEPQSYEKYVEEYYNAKQFYNIKKEDTSILGRSDLSFIPYDNCHIPFIVELKVNSTPDEVIA